jgi:hypothetical protein
MTQEQMELAVKELYQREQEIETLKIKLAEMPDFNLIDAYELFDE